MKFRFIPALALVVALIFILSYGLFQISRSRQFQFFGGIINRVNTNEKIVALTFDDGPSEYSDQVVNLLQGKGVKATFYVTGYNLEQYPNEARDMVADGHELGNHSYSHQRFLLKSQSFIKTEIERTNQLIRSIGHRGEITFRPPNGKKLFLLPWYLKQNNIKTITWDVDPDTYLPDSVGQEDKIKFIRDYTIGHTKPGSIILIHPFCESCGYDRQALGGIIDNLQADGYKFVTVSELLEHNQ
jgi:peptidoglycan/xylan/chitin deacetylase (PgdA/CDA1 family)